MKTKNPLFKFKYVEGLGDLIRCIIHSKFITFFIKEPEYCNSCSTRAYALNLLCNVPLWKLFFKTKEEMKKSFKKEIEEFGYTYIEEETSIITIDNEINPDPTIGSFDSNQIVYDGFYFLSKTEVDYDSTRVVTLAFKKN
jgi:hypothetical protein